MNGEACPKIAAWLKEGRRAVAFTGAGISIKRRREITVGG